MRSIRAIRPGGPEVLEICDVPEPEPGAGDVVVAIAATALNRADLLQRRGLYPPPPGASDILGLECSGRVIACGRETAAANLLGQQVMALLPAGGYAERVAIPAALCVPVPTGVTLLEAAAIPEAFFTAQEALFTLAALQPAERVFIHAGASGVGSAAVQLALMAGATVFASAGSPEKCARIEALGARCFNRHSQDFAAAVLDATRGSAAGPGVDVILDFVGAKNLDAHVRLLAPGGRLICIGLLGGTSATLDLSQVIQKRLKLLGLVMRSRSLLDKVAIARRFQRELLPRFGSELKPIIDSVFPFEQVRAAHERLESNATFGKVVLSVAEL